MSDGFDDVSDLADLHEAVEDAVEAALSSVLQSFGCLLDSFVGCAGYLTATGDRAFLMFYPDSQTMVTTRSMTTHLDEFWREALRQRYGNQIQAAENGE